MSDKLRITGLATGLDVDSLVKNMMKGQNMRLDKLKQDRQLVSWRQDAYRQTLTDISSLRNTYLDLLSPQDTNMLSANNYAAYDVTSKDSTIVTASAGTGANPGTYKISFIKDDSQLATTASLTKANFADAITKNSKVMDVDGVTIGKIGIQYNNNGKTDSIEIEITSDTKIYDLINSIYTKSKGNVKANYSELTKSFVIESANTGQNNTIKITDNTNFMGLGAGEKSSDLINGKNAIVYVTPPGGEAVRVEKQTNNFTIDGITYNLLSDIKDGTKTETTLTITSNPDKTFDKIKTFIDKYNEMIDKINKQLDQKKQYTYKPLTDDQKKDMKDDDIKKWEDKAKEGLLRNDSSLQGMLYSMRRAFFDSVEGAGISLDDVGLSTSSDIGDRGKIVLQKGSDGEYKLKNAIKNNPQKVADLFRKDSDIPYDPNHKTDKERYNEIGIFRRIDDILKDYTRTTRDDNGKKGILIEIAGVKGDLSEATSLLSKELRDNYDKRISDLATKLSAMEDQYYKKFSQLETVMQKLNDQSNWLNQQLGLGGK